MAFGDFTFPEMAEHLALRLWSAALFPGASPVEPDAEFAGRLRGGVALALDVNTVKARREFVVAPVLLELRRTHPARFGLFSGTAFDINSARGLDGACDFLLTRSPMQLILRAPVVAVVEAKNDSIASGLGPCIATMVAAREFNARAPSDPPVRAVYGVVTTGSAWKFLRLVESDLAIDPGEVFVSELGRIMGNLAFALRGI